jgi:hypothetical protein
VHGAFIHSTHGHAPICSDTGTTRAKDGARVTKLPRVSPLTVALLGLGEAGRAIAGDLVAAGASVRGFDPAGDGAPQGVHLAADARTAVAGTDLVLSVNAAAAAVQAAGSAAGGLRPGHVYADLN